MSKTKKNSQKIRKTVKNRQKYRKIDKNVEKLRKNYQKFREPGKTVKMSKNR